MAAGEEVGRSYLVYVDDSFSLANIRDEALAKLERDLTLLQARPTGWPCWPSTARGSTS